MAISRKKTPGPEAAGAVNPAKADAFIAGAPDAHQAPAPKAIKTAGNKAVISLSIDPDLLARLDAWAKQRGMSRAAAVAFAVSNLD